MAAMFCKPGLVGTIYQPLFVDSPIHDHALGKGEENPRHLVDVEEISDRFQFCTLLLSKILSRGRKCATAFCVEFGTMR